MGQPKAAKGSGSDNFLTPELVARFDFELIGQTPVNDRMAYQVSFKPKNPEPPVHRIVDRLLNRLSGTIWIDVQEFEVAKADVQLRSEVNLLGGVASSLKKLRLYNHPQPAWLTVCGSALLRRVTLKVANSSSRFG